MKTTDDIEDELDMTEEEFEGFLAEAIYVFSEEHLGNTERDPRMVDIRSFEEAAILTMNKGLVVKVGDREFQVTVVRSR